MKSGWDMLRPLLLTLDTRNLQVRSIINSRILVSLIIVCEMETYQPPGPVLGITNSTPTPWIRDEASLWVCAASQKLLADFPAGGLSRCRKASMSFGKLSFGNKWSKFQNPLYIWYYHIVWTAWRMAIFPKSVAIRIPPSGRAGNAAPCRASKASCCSASSSVRPSLMARLDNECVAYRWCLCHSLSSVQDVQVEHGWTWLKQV